MKYFVFFSTILLILYLVEFVKKDNRTFTFMNKAFTKAIKGFAILTVVWAHTGARLGVGGIQFIAGVGVALFLICSGYGLEMSNQKNGLKGFWKKRFLKVCIPFWIVELVGLLITQQFEIKKYLLDAVFISPATGYGWFMQYIVNCYILFFGVKMMSEKTRINEMRLFIVASVVWFIVDSCFFANSGMPFLRARQMFSFPLGIMIAKNRDRIESYISRKRAVILIWGVIGILFMAITQLSAIKALPYLISNVMALFTVLPLAIAFIAFVGKAKVLLNNKFLLGVGTVSYEIYLVHAFSLNLVKGSLVWVSVFVAVTAVLACVLYLGQKKMIGSRV